MPKRKHDETREERWERKRMRYEAKLAERRRKNSQRIVYTSEEEDVQIEEHLPNGVDDAEVVPTISEGGVQAPDEATAPDGVTNHEVTEADHPPPPPPEEPEPEIDVDMLAALGEFDDEPIEWGPDINEDVAKRFERVLLNGLKTKLREELTKKYSFPKNAPSTKPPSLNPEMSANMLQESAKTRDKRILDKQGQLGRALATLGYAMTALLKKNLDKNEVMQKLNDAGQLLADSHHAETETRRALLIPLIDKSLVESFKERKRDNFLFGDKLYDLVRNSRGIMRTGQMMQASAPSTSGDNLNSRGPSTRYRQIRPGPSQTNRVGGQRQHYGPRHRPAPPPPPPPPSRRRQPPPPPVRRQQPAARTAAQHPLPPSDRTA